MTTPDDTTTDLDGRLRSTLDSVAGSIHADPISVTTIVHRSRRRRARARTAGAVAGASALVLGAAAVVRHLSDEQVTTTVDDPDPTSTTAPPGTVTVPVPTTQPDDTTAPTTPVLTVTPTTAPPTTTSTEPTPTTARSSDVVVTPAEHGLILRADGLGVATFGQDADSAFVALTDVLGPPSHDFGWVPAGTGFESRPNRMVAWGGFWVTFIEDAAGRHLAYWRYAESHADFPSPRGTPVLETADGIALGMTYGEVIAISGPGTKVVGEGGNGLRVGVATGNLYVWFDPVWLTGATPAPDAVVVGLDAGDTTEHEP